MCVLVSTSLCVTVMTPKRIARIRKSFTTADLDDLCDEVERLQTALVVSQEQYAAEHDLVIAQDMRIEQLCKEVKKLGNTWDDLRGSLLD